MNTVDALVQEWSQSLYNYEHKVIKKGEIKIISYTILRMSRRISLADMEDIDERNLDELTENIRRFQFSSGIIS